MMIYQNIPNDTAKKLLVVALGALSYSYLLVNSQFIAWPEMLLWPHLASNGFMYYQDILTVYPPLLLRLLETIAHLSWSIQVLWALSLAMAVLLGVTFWTICYKTTKSPNATLLALFLYLGWQIRFEGIGLWFDHVIAWLGMLTWWWLWSKKHRLARFSLASSLLVKQTAIYWVLATALTFTPRKKLFAFLLGVATITLLTNLFLVPFSNGQKYLSAISIGITYLPQHPSQIQLPTAKQLLISSVPLITLAIVIITWKIKNPKLPNKTLQNNTAFKQVLTWATLGALGTFSRFELFHLQPSLPFVALAIGIVFTEITKPPFTNKYRWLVGTSLSSIFLINILLLLQHLQPGVGHEPRFVDAENIRSAHKLNNIIGNQTVYIYDTWDHLYFLMDKIPPIKWIYPSTQAFFDYPGNQQKTLDLLQSSLPNFIITSNLTNPKLIDAWVSRHYTLEHQLDEEYWLYRQNQPHQ